MRHKFLNWFVDLVVISLYASGLVYVLTQSLVLPQQVYVLFGICFAFGLVFSFFAKFKKAGLLIGGAAVVLALGMLLVANEFATWLFAFIGDSFVWIFSYILGSQGYRYGAYVWVGPTILCASATLCTMLLVKLTRRVWPLVIAFAAVYLTAWVMGKFSVLTALPFGILALVPLAARGYGKELAQKNVTTSGKIWILSVWGIVFAALLSYGLWAVVPEDTRNWRNPGVVYAAQDINDFIQERTGWKSPTNRSVFSLRSSGFYPNGVEDLGGDIAPGKNTVFDVYTDSGVNLLLRGATYATYTGTGWMAENDNAHYRFDSSLWRPRRIDVFDMERPTYSDRRYYDEVHFIKQIEYRIIQRQGGYSTMFVPIRVKKLWPLGDQLALIPYFNAQAEMFDVKNILPGQQYGVVGEVINRKSAKFESAFREQYVRYYGNDSQEKMDEIHLQYLQLPQDLPQSIANLAHEVTYGLADPMDKALALEEYLQNNFAYTLQPGDVPDGKDFVEHFLQTQQGYCTYFATAMTVMARTLDLPARYVEGFCTPAQIERPFNFYSVRAENAHAWVEIYFNGIGWITFDPTPANYLTHTPTGSKPPEPLPDETPSVLPMTTPEATDELPMSTLDPQLIMKERQQRILGYVKLAVYILGALIVLWLVLTRIYAFTKFSMKNTDKRFKYNPREKLFFYYRDILRLLQLMGKEAEIGETPYQYAARTDGWLRNPEATMMKMTQLMVSAHFGKYVPTPTEIESIYWFRKMLNKQYWHVVGPFVYWQTRVFGITPRKPASEKRLTRYLVRQERKQKRNRGI